jgi:hypothetical protein
LKYSAASTDIESSPKLDRLKFNGFFSNKKKFFESLRKNGASCFQMFHSIRMVKAKFAMISSMSDSKILSNFFSLVTLFWLILKLLGNQLSHQGQKFKIFNTDRECIKGTLKTSSNRKSKIRINFQQFSVHQTEIQLNTFYNSQQKVMDQMQRIINIAFLQTNY